MYLKGKKGVIMGLANDHSIAWGVAKKLSDEGAELCFMYAGETLLRRVQPLAESLNSNFLIECNVLDTDSIQKAFNQVKDKWGSIDFVLHSIAFSDKNELKGKYLYTSRDNFTQTMLISCFSFTETAKEASKLMVNGGALVTLSYDGSQRVVPNYNVMGVAKAALESSVRYLANDFGVQNIRVNSLNSGPMKTFAIACRV
jgi:enoyl-[acyl-carrier protein] reductase I